MPANPAEGPPRPRAVKPPDEPAPAADVIPGKLWLREDDGFVTVRLIVHGAKVEYKDGVFELKLPKPNQ